MSIVDWDKFRMAAEAMPLNPFHQVLEPFLGGKGRALDLGCGTGRSSTWLAERGFEVDAVDSDETSLRLARQRIVEYSDVHLFSSDFADFELDNYDLVLSLFSVFFQPRPAFDSLWPRLVDSLNRDGLFAGQLIGPEDDWADESSSFFGREEVDELFQGFVFEHFEEVKRPGKTVWGEDKRWHVYHVVARKSG